MSNITPYQNAIAESQRKFVEIMTKAETNVVFEIESMFAVQALSKDDYLAGIANKNLDSLRNAIINIASIGLSLNPVMQYAFLVPRDKAVCLDISYKGLIKLATDSGSILWAKADLVHEHDQFEYLGPAKIPNHSANIFGDRGKFVGCYCVAKTCDGDFLIETMSAQEIDQVKNASKTTSADTPWRKWFGEMAKKTVIKRASKTWPRSDKNDRLYKAVEMLNENDGFANDIDISAPDPLSDDQIIAMNDAIKEYSVDKEKFLKYAEVDTIDDIESSRFDKLMSAIKSKGKK